MKAKYFLGPVILALFFVTHVFADEPSSSRADRSEDSGIFGGMGGPIFKMNNMGDGLAYSIGGRGAMSLMGIFLFGAGGLGQIAHGDITVGDKKEKVSLGYGGLGLGFKLFPSAIVHISRFNMFNIGRISLEGRGESSTCFVIEPELNAEFSIISFLRFGIGANYRYIIAKGISLPSKDLSGFGGQVYVEFGWL